MNRFLIIIAYKGDDIMDIELRPHSKIKDFLDHLHSRLEDLMFSAVQHLPEQMIPDSLMNWLDRYTSKRIDQLRQQTIKQTWRNMYLENAVQEISGKQTQK
jgi:predicted RNA polymerase sigma factor